MGAYIEGTTRGVSPAVTGVALAKLEDAMNPNARPFNFNPGAASFTPERAGAYPASGLSPPKGGSGFQELPGRRPHDRHSPGAGGALNDGGPSPSYGGTPGYTPQQGYNGYSCPSQGYPAPGYGYPPGMSEISHCRAGPPSGQSQRVLQYQDSQGLGYFGGKGRHSEHANHAHEGKTESVPQSAIQLAEARVRAAAAGAEIHQAQAIIVSPCLPYCSWSRMKSHPS